jgi:predicted RND superfamily exporter protein
MTKQKEQRSFTDRLCDTMTRRRAWVLAIILAITIGFLFGVFHIKGEVVLSELFPYDHPYLKLHARFSQVFGGGGTRAIIALKATKGDIFNERTLTKIQNMTNEVVLWDEVYRSLTSSMASNVIKVVNTKGSGEISMEPLMFPNIPKNEDEMETLKRNIFSNPAYSGSIVSEDGKACLLMTEFKENVSYQTAFKLLNKLRKDYTDSETSVHIVGFPMLMGWIYSLTPQTLMVSLLSFVLMIVILYIMFRNLVGMLAPMVGMIVLTIIGLGFIGFTGINFSPLLYVLAFLMIARIVSNSVQLTYRYLEEFHACGNDNKKACYETMRVMLFPNWTGVSTDMAGFAALYIAKIVLLQNLAIIMTFWMFTIGLTGIMIPVVCSFIPMAKASQRFAKESSQMDWQARAIASITRYTLSPRGRYIVGAIIVVFFVLCSWQMTRLKVGDPTPGSSLFFKNHTYNQDQALINETFKASSENLALYYEGEDESVYDPAVFTTFLDFDRHMERTLPDIYKSSNSFLNLIRMVNETYHEGDKLWYDLPRDPEMTTVMISAAMRNAGRGTLGLYMDEFKKQSQLNLFFADHTSDNILRIRDAAYGFFKDHPNKTEKGQFILAGGSIGMELGLNQEMIHAHALIDSAVLGAIFLLITLGFMSIVGGFMVTLPLIFANCTAFAYMALRNIGMTINTLPVAAAGLGIGDNFCIYLYSRCREELPLRNGDWKEAIIQSVCTSGKAVVYTGITIILPILTWYLFSDFRFQAEVGLFLSIIMIGNVLLTLTLHPLMIYLIKPKFISRGVSTPKEVIGGEAVFEKNSLE